MSLVQLITRAYEKIHIVKKLMKEDAKEDRVIETTNKVVMEAVLVIEIGTYVETLEHQLYTI